MHPMRFKRANNFRSIGMIEWLKRFSRHPYVAYGWRFIFAGYILIYLFSGQSPFSLISHYLNALSESTETIRLYASQARSTMAEDNSTGWSNSEAATGAPDLSGEASYDQFGPANAARYRGGEGILVLHNFRPLVLPAALNEADPSTSSGTDILLPPEPGMNSGNLPTMNINDTETASGSETVEAGNPAAAESNGQSIPAGIFSGIASGTTDQIATSGNPVPGISSSTDVEVYTASTTDDRAVEIIGQGGPEPSVDVIESDTASTSDLNGGRTDSGNWLDLMSPLSLAQPAHAQEYIRQDVSDLSELGELQEAKIGISLAAGADYASGEFVPYDDASVEPDTTDGGSAATAGFPAASATSSAGYADTGSGTMPYISAATTTAAVPDAEAADEPTVEVMDNIEAASSSAVVVPDNGTDASSTAVLSLSRLFGITPAQAQNQLLADAKLAIWYSLDKTADTGTTTADDRLWQLLDVVSVSEISNNLNHGYLEYDAPFLRSWPDVDNLEIKFEGLSGAGTSFTAYIDSLWVEARYQPENELDKLKKRQRWETALELLSRQTVFIAGENGEIRFRYNKNEERIWDTLFELAGLGDYWSNVDIQIQLFDSRGQATDITLVTLFGDNGEFSIKLPDDMHALMPGRYTLHFHIEDDSGDEAEIFDFDRYFYWGVTALNFNKSSYSAGETAYLQMAALDNIGHAICDANVELRIMNVELQTQEVLNTEYGSIKSSNRCGPETVTDEPDYYAYYEFGNAGQYEFTMTVDTADGSKSVTETIAVTDERAPFVVERAGPTRIYPKADFGMNIRIAPTGDFRGDIIESVPGGFKITNYALRIVNNTELDPFGPRYGYEESFADDVKLLAWHDVELKAGDVLEITYTFDAPDISPELFLLGPLQTVIANRQSPIENRMWQIASDAVRKRARTVMFMAGTYNGGASAGINTNADTTFSAFKFKLAETGVTIKDAFILFESQYEAYTAVSDTNYTGYKLGFDACETGTCSLNPFSGTGKVLEDNSNILSYDDAGGNDGESEDVRLLLDVSAESQLAAYTGNGVEYQAQVGYHFKNSATKTSIASAKAVLILTYTYDIDSPNITNTVVYPLDSTDGSDRGSRVSNTGSCNRDSGSGGTCPIFDYEMEIPEFPAYSPAAHRLSQWFTMYDMNDSNGGTDLDPNINIQTFNVDSPSFHFESALGGTQCTVPAMYFPNWASSGYTENSAQQLEYYVNAGTNWSVGGEVYETYIASSSAAEKTRTASFPYGVINNGAVTTLTSANVNVYFPENGEATGTVKIKSAWVRIIPNHFDNDTMNTTVSTKVGNNATSSDLVYGYNAGTTAVKNSYNIINIIPQSDYAALEEANAGNPVTVRVNTTYNNADFGGISAELMITYTYTEESNGYLTSIGLYGGQLTAAPATSVNLSTAHSVLPEESGKTILAGALLASYLNSDTGGDVGAGSVFLMDANLSASTPACTNSFEVEPDDVNSYKELYKNITSALNTTDDQSYTACYSHDTVLSATDAAKMNGILYYTYGWSNSPPTGSFITASTTQKADGSGAVDIGIEIDDPDDQETRVMLEFATGTSCVFSPSGDPTLDETNDNITADFGDPYIDNGNAYQIGTADGYIKTASGSNSVFFDWLAAGDLGAVEGDYCLRLTTNDLYLDQAASATTTIHIDTIYPTAPGPLSFFSRTGTTMTLSFGATSTETNFREYVVYYKPYDGTDPDESDSFLASGTDANLLDISFNDAATTAAITGLTASTTYSFAIWAYDIYGNRASSSRVDITTNDAPSGEFKFYPNTRQKTDGSGVVQISVDIDDDNNQDTVKAKLEYVAGASCDFSTPLDPTLDPASISASFGLPSISNAAAYQVGQPGAWIITSPGMNTIGFNWLGRTDAPSADGDYCLRLTANDRFDDQIPTTTVIKLDNVNPSPTGDLTAGNVTTASIRLVYAINNPATDTNEPGVNAYKIFYKQGTSGVTVNSPHEVDNTDLNSYDYGGATSTVVSGLDSNTWYVFNIWSYDSFGNRATATEVAVKTNATLSNGTLAFTNAETSGPASNIAVADSSTEWNFRVTVNEDNGWYAISSTTLRLADQNDSISPYSDLRFRWYQTGQTFTEIGGDLSNAVTLSGNSTSTCALNTCTIDFKLIFNKNFTVSGVNYGAEIFSDNDYGVTDTDSFPNVFQVRYPYVIQTHYRWRNDDGGE